MWSVGNIDSLLSSTWNQSDSISLSQAMLHHFYNKEKTRNFVVFIPFIIRFSGLLSVGYMRGTIQMDICVRWMSHITHLMTPPASPSQSTHLISFYNKANGKINEGNVMKITPLDPIIGQIEKFLPHWWNPRCQ